MFLYPRISIFKKSTQNLRDCYYIYFQTCDSTDTITSSSSTDGDLDQTDSYYLSGQSQQKGDNFSVQYTNLLEDSDSGIVMRSNSQSSLDRTRFESGYHNKSESEFTAMSEQKLPPPRPAPRRSITPNTGPANEDRLITSRPAARERPKPAPRKLSFENQAPQPSGDNRSASSFENLIDFSANNAENEQLDLVDEFEQLNSSGDYVLLRQPKTSNSHLEIGSKRYSISRTPAMKLGQNETPKRPSIRRERSPVSPDDSPQSGSSLLDFDPLASKLFNQETKTPSVSQSRTESGTNKPDQSDSLLKDWDIGQLTNISNTQNRAVNQSGYRYGHPTPPARQPITTGMTNQFYTPQPQMANRSTGSPNALGFNNQVAQMHSSAPQVPPRPHKNRAGLQNTNTPAANQSNDPFADLLNLSQPKPQSSTQKTASWETFN